MIIKPRIKGFICTTSHPVGCAKNVENQINFVKKQGPIANGPKKVLIIGASTGYGLASRIVAAFGSQAATMGVFFEKEAEEKRTATAGWYNSVAFDRAAKKAGLYSKSFNVDAFSDQAKQMVVDQIKKDLGQVDLVIYSLASPRRTHPKTGVLSKSVLKPTGKPYSNKSIDLDSQKIIDVTIPIANQEEIDQTIAVMGGEDWEMWMDALLKENLIAKNAMTVAYSYVGPDITQDVYRKGTIGAAKDHLEATAKKLDTRLKSLNGHAYVSVNKAIVTQSSSAIPVIPLYFMLLNKVMNEKNVNEDTVGQIDRLFREKIYGSNVIPTDKEGRIRIDDYETRADVQEEVNKRWAIISNDNFAQLGDYDGFRADFLRLFGFGLSDVNYDADVETNLPLE